MNRTLNVEQATDAEHIKGVAAFIQTKRGDGTEALCVCARLIDDYFHARMVQALNAACAQIRKSKVPYAVAVEHPLFAPSFDSAAEAQHAQLSLIAPLLRQCAARLSDPCFPQWLWNELSTTLKSARNSADVL